MISEYSYETTFSQRFKTQDYDLFYELVGSEEHIDSVINLHKVFFSLILGLEQHISETTIEKDLGLHDKFIKVIEKLKLKADSQDLVAPSDLHLSPELHKQFEFESLNEAQITKCYTCYLHALLNERALRPLGADPQESVAPPSIAQPS